MKFKIRRGHPDTTNKMIILPAQGTSFQTGTAPSGGPLPVEAQIFLRVMGEDFDGAADLARTLSWDDREILALYCAQVTELIYRVDENRS